MLAHPADFLLVCLSVCLSVRPSVRLSVCQLIFQSGKLGVCLVGFSVWTFAMGVGTLFLFIALQQCGSLHSKAMSMCYDVLVQVVDEVAAI